jgi:hypothetical protein
MKVLIQKDPILHIIVWRWVLHRSGFKIDSRGPMEEDVIDCLEWLHVSFS